MKNNLLRRSAAAVAVGVLAVTGLASCAPGGPSTEKSEALTIASTTTTFTQNFNFLAPTNSATPPGIDLVYEPLISLSPTNGWEPTGWLAKSWEWADDGKKLTFELNDVDWSDGEPLTSADVAFTLQLSDKYPQLVQGNTGDVVSVETPDDKTVVVNYAEPSYGTFRNYYGVHIIPEHIWNDVDPLIFTNEEPVGTGPFVLDRFVPQQVTYTLRDDYWNGESKGVEKVIYKALASPDTILQELLTGKVDYAESPLVGNPLTDFVGKDPKTNHFWLPEPGAGNAMLFNNAVAPTDDVNIRRALFASLSPEQLISLSPASAGSAANITGVNAPGYQEWIAPEFQDKVVTQDVDAAMSALKASDYTVENGILTKDGTAYPLTLITNPSDPWGAAIAQQVEEVLGVKVEVKQDSEASTKMQTGDYTLAIQAPDVPGQGLPPGVAWNVAAPTPVGEAASTNWARANSPEAQALATQLSATNDVEEQKELVFQIERIMVDQRFTAPINPYAWQIAYTTRHWAGWPDSEKPASIPSNGRGDLIKTILALTPAG